MEILKVGQDNDPENCRAGFEAGDSFDFSYLTPPDFCPTAFIKMFPLLEVVRCEGDLRNLGGREKSQTEFVCPGGVVFFRLRGMKNQPEQKGGAYGR